MISMILEWLESGKSFENILEAYPQLINEDISAIVRFPRKLIEEDKNGGLF